MFEQKIRVNKRIFNIGHLGNFWLISSFVLGFAILLALLVLSGFSGVGRKSDSQALASSGNAAGVEIGGKIAFVKSNIQLYISWPLTGKDYLVAEVPQTKIKDPDTGELVDNIGESIIKPVFSPDGAYLAFERTIVPYDGYMTERPGSLWVATGDGRSAKLIADDVVFSHWSDDGKWVYCYHIAVESAASLPSVRIWQRHEVETGKVEVLMDKSSTLSALWLSSAISSTGETVYVEPIMDALLGAQVEGFKLILLESGSRRIIAVGGDILGKTQGRAKALPPQWSPNGRYVATTVYSNLIDGWEEWEQWDKSAVYVYDTQLHKGHKVGSISSFVCWSPDSRGLVVPHGDSSGVVDLDGNGYTPVFPVSSAADWSAKD